LFRLRPKAAFGVVAHANLGDDAKRLPVRHRDRGDFDLREPPEAISC
jgi:hypothetical protein